MTDSGIILLKYWLEVGPEEQTRRLEPHPRPAQGLEALADGPALLQSLVRLLPARDECSPPPTPPGHLVPGVDGRQEAWPAEISATCSARSPTSRCRREHVERPARQKADGAPAPPPLSLLGPSHAVPEPGLAACHRDSQGAACAVPGAAGSAAAAQGRARHRAGRSGETSGAPPVAPRESRSPLRRRRRGRSDHRSPSRGGGGEQCGRRRRAAGALDARPARPYVIRSPPVTRSTSTMNRRGNAPGSRRRPSGTAVRWIALHARSLLRRTPGQPGAADVVSGRQTDASARPAGASILRGRARTGPRQAGRATDPRAFCRPPDGGT